MKVGLKYCGGCDPRYERGALVRRARREFPEHSFTPYDREDQYDVVLVICGCMAECFTFRCGNSRYGTVWVRCPEEYERIRRFFENAYGEDQAPWET